MTCLLTAVTPSLIVPFHFLGRLVLCILALASAFRVLDFAFVLSAGAMLPAPGLLTACSLENLQDVSLSTQGMATTNVDECLAWE